MDERQLELWKTVAKGMCYHFWENATQARKDRLWREVEGFIDEVEGDDPASWDQGETYLCDWFSDYFDDYQRDVLEYKNGEVVGERNNYHSFVNQLRCVVRASIDLCGDEEGWIAGVVGFTTGDLRRVFGGTIPDWVLTKYETLTNDTPDQQAVWL